MKTYKFLPALCMFTLIISFLGCKKPITEPSAASDVKTSSLSVNAIAKASFTTPDSVAGNNGSWGRISYDLNLNKAWKDSLQLSFDGTLCREIHAGQGYKLGYVDISGTSLASIGLQDIAPATLKPISIAKYKESQVSNWYTFSDDNQYGLIPVKDRYVVLYKGESIAKATVLYVLQLNTVDYVPAKLSGYEFGNISFNYRRLI